MNTNAITEIALMQHVTNIAVATGSAAWDVGRAVFLAAVAVGFLPLDERPRALCIALAAAVAFVALKAFVSEVVFRDRAKTPVQHWKNGTAAALDAAHTSVERDAASRLTAFDIARRRAYPDSRPNGWYRVCAVSELATTHRATTPSGAEHQHDERAPSSPPLAVSILGLRLVVIALADESEGAASAAQKQPKSPQRARVIELRGAGDAVEHPSCVWLGMVMVWFHRGNVITARAPTRVDDSETAEAAAADGTAAACSGSTDGGHCDVDAVLASVRPALHRPAWQLRTDVFAASENWECVSTATTTLDHHLLELASSASDTFHLEQVHAAFHISPVIDPITNAVFRVHHKVTTQFGNQIPGRAAAAAADKKLQSETVPASPPVAGEAVVASGKASLPRSSSSDSSIASLGATTTTAAAAAASHDACDAGTAAAASQPPSQPQPQPSPMIGAHEMHFNHCASISVLGHAVNWVDQRTAVVYEGPAIAHFRLVVPAMGAIHLVRTQVPVGPFRVVAHDQWFRDPATPNVVVWFLATVVSLALDAESAIAENRCLNWARPGLVEGDGPFGKFQRWWMQFYVDAPAA